MSVVSYANNAGYLISQKYLIDYFYYHSYIIIIIIIIIPDDSHN